jgi:hypothetical protein
LCRVGRSTNVSASVDPPLPCAMRPGIDPGQSAAYLGPIAGLAARYHAGHNPGFLALTAWLPNDVAVTVLSNDEVTDVEQVARDALATHGQGER